MTGLKSPPYLLLAVVSVCFCWQNQGLFLQDEPQGQRSVLKVLENSGNVEYNLKINMGSNKEEVIMSIEPGTSELWIPITDCINCSGELKYSAEESSSFLFLNDNVENIKTKTTDMSARWSEDTLSLNANTNLENFMFLSVFEEKPVVKHQFQGIFGLGKGSKAPKILQVLKGVGLISSHAISFALHKVELESFIIFGEPDMSHACPQTSVNVTVPLDSKFQFKVDKSEYGAQDLLGNSLNAIIDLSQPASGVPKDQFSRMVRFIEKNFGLVKREDGKYEGKCQKLPLYNLTLTIDSAEITLPFDNLWTMGEPGDGMCTLLLYEASQWILGTQILQNYYIIQDFDASTMSMYNSNLATVNKPNKEYTNGVAVFVIIISVAVAIVVGIILGVCCKRKRMIQRMKINQDLDEELKADIKPQGYLSVSALYEAKTEAEVEI